jgi:hypothetical protein
MNKKLNFLLTKFLKDSKREFLISGLFLALSAPFGYSFSSGQLLGQNRLSVFIKLEDIKRNPLAINIDFNRSSSLSFGDSNYSYTLSTVPGASLVEFMFSGFYKYLIPDTIPRDEEDNYIKSLSEDKFKGGRTARWYYAWVIFKDYPWYKKLFGGGFDYLEMYGKEFGESEYDYPHNPFISAFLYSGIIGGILYILFMFMVFYYYIKFWRYHIYFFICFLVVFFFSFVSANTHFSVPVFAFFSFIPFLTKYLVERESLQNSKNITNE